MRLLVEVARHTQVCEHAGDDWEIQQKLSSCDAMCNVITVIKVVQSATLWTHNVLHEFQIFFFNKCRDFGNDAVMTVAKLSKIAPKNSRRISSALSEITQKEDHKHKKSKIQRIMLFILSRNSWVGLTLTEGSCPVIVGKSMSISSSLRFHTWWVSSVPILSW